MSDLFMNLNWADYFIIIVIGLSTLTSIARGFVKETFSLATWLLAMWIGLQFAPQLADILKNTINTPSLRLVLSFVALFLSVLILGGMLNFLVSQLITKTGLSGTNRLMGSAFGFLRGVLIVGMMILFARHTALPQDPWWTSAQLIPQFEPVADQISRLMPEKLQKISELI